MNKTQQQQNISDVMLREIFTKFGALRPFSSAACSARAGIQATKDVSANKHSVTSLTPGLQSASSSVWNRTGCHRLLSGSLLPLCSLNITRGVFYAYRPNARKHMKKHGLEKRLSCRSQREILFRRVLKGRNNLSTFDRFRNELPDVGRKRSLRVNLFDPKHGYKSVVKKPEYFKFPDV